MRKTALFGALLLLGLLVVLISPASLAFAHSRLVKSQPVAGSSMEVSPNEISLELSEAVAVDFSTVKLYDKDRGEKALGPPEPGANPNTLVVPVTAVLPLGRYTVVWRVVSAVDGHLTVGSYAFRVGPPAQAGTPEAETTPEAVTGSPDAPVEGSAENAGPLRWLLRALILGCAAFVTGGALFVVLILEPAAGDRGEPGEAIWIAAVRRQASLAWVVAAVLLVALFVDLFAEVAAIGGVGLFDSVSRSDLAGTLISSTRYGFAWSMKTIAAALVLVLMLALALRREGAQGRTATGLWEISIAAGSFMLLAESLSSHAAAVEGAQVLGLPLPVVSDWLHLVTASFWVGGLAFITAVLFPTFRRLRIAAPERRAFLAAAIPRFSVLAIASVAVLGITGLYNVGVHTTDVGAILGTDYGKLLATKIGLYLVLIALGAVNFIRVTPQLRARATSEGEAGDSGAIRPVTSLSRNVRVEVVLALVVLVLAGGLTLVPPPQGEASTYASPGAHTPAEMAMPTAESTPPASAAVAVAESRGYRLTLAAQTAAEGDTLTVTMTKALVAAPAITDVTRVLVRVIPQDIEAGSEAAQATPSGLNTADAASWTARGQLLTVSGTYVVNVVVQRAQSDDVKAAFRLSLSPAGGLTASAEPVVDVLFDTDPSPPHAGSNRIVTTLRDGDGQPVAGAKVSLLARLPSAGVTVGPVLALPDSTRPSRYSAPVELPRAGAWLLIVTVQREGYPDVRVDASFDVGGATSTP